MVTVARIIVLAALATVIAVKPLPAQWYRDYEGAIQKLDNGEYLEALERIDHALATDDSPRLRKRAQSTRYISYFPYLYRGKILYYLGRYQEAIADLEKSRAAGEVLRDDWGKREWYQYYDWSTIKYSSEILNEGIYWFNQRVFDKARLNFQQVLQVDSANAAAGMFVKILDGFRLEEVNVARYGNKALLELEQGKKYYEQGHLQQAVINFSIALALDSTLDEAGVYLQRSKQELDAIRQRLEQEENMSAGQKDRLALLDTLSQGLAAYAGGRFAEAEKLLAAVANRDPANEMAREFLARCQASPAGAAGDDTELRERISLLESQLEKASETNAGQQRQIEALNSLTLGLNAYSTNDFQNAVRLLEEYLRYDPRSPLAAGYLENARKAMASPILAPHPDSLQQALYASMDSLQTCLDKFAAQVRHNNQSAAQLRRMREGVRSLLRGENGLSVALFEEILQDEPDNEIASGLLELARRGLDGSADAGAAVTELKSRVDKEMEQGLALLTSGNFRESLAHFGIVRGLDPGNASAVRYYELAENALKRMETQKFALKDATQPSPDMQARKNELLFLALSLFLARDYETAKASLENVIKEFPQDLEVNDMLMACQRGIEAKQENTRLTDLFNQYMQSGRRLFEQGDFEKARDDLKVALALEPDNLELAGMVSHCDSEIARDRAGKIKSGTFFYFPAFRKDMEVVSSRLMLEGVVYDDRGVSEIAIRINGNTVGQLKAPVEGERGPGGSVASMEVKYPVLLKEGENQICLVCITVEGEIDSAVVGKILFQKHEGAVIAALFGVAAYQNVAPLNYTVNDVQEFKQTLLELGVPEENIITRVNTDVTAQTMRTVLGSQLKRMAEPQDQVIIFFSGHGGFEPDENKQNADGFEKYLLPYDADPTNYYGTAYPMTDIAEISSRLRANTVFFIIDACYSGAAGGLSPLAGNIDFSQEYIDRVSNRNGRIILTASGPKEPSVESKDLEHGVFTYFLVNALKGKADRDGDGLVSVNELNEFISTEVRKMTDGRQNPVFKGSFSGNIYLGRI